MMRKGFTLIELMIVVAIIAVIAAIAIPNLVQSRIASNETSAVASCVVILSGQATFHKTAFYTAAAQPMLVYAAPAAAGVGRGVIDLYQTAPSMAAGGPPDVALIDRSLAVSWQDADDAVSPISGTLSNKAGYYVTDLVTSAISGAYTADIQFAIQVYPASFERSGRNEFVMDTGGTVYQRMATSAPTAGAAVLQLTNKEYPDVATDWIAVGNG